MVEADVADLIERCRPTGPRIEVSTRTTLHREPMQTPPDAELTQALLAAAGPGTRQVPVSYWADSAFLSSAGIPTVLYGPEGEGDHRAHSPATDPVSSGPCAHVDRRNASTLVLGPSA